MLLFPIKMANLFPVLVFTACYHEICLIVFYTHLQEQVLSLIDGLDQSWVI